MLRHKAPEPTVQTIVAIVPHQEDMAGGHGEDLGIVAVGLASIEHVIALPAGQRLAIARDAALRSITPPHIDIIAL